MVGVISLATVSVYLLISMMDTCKMEALHMKGTKDAVDLERLIEEFTCWQETTADVVQENSKLHSEVSGLQKLCTLHKQEAATAVEDGSQLRHTVEKLHSILAKRCDMEEDNSQLKERIASMQSAAEQLEEEHRQQMSEAVENLNAVHEAHKREIAQLHGSANQQAKREVEGLQRTIQEGNSEIRQLQKHLADLERDKHTEVVKLRLEYDAKLLKLQKQTSKAQTTQPSTSVNNDIFRRKLQNVKAESEREVFSLKRRVQELERQLSLVSKRRKL